MSEADGKRKKRKTARQPVALRKSEKNNEIEYRRVKHIVASVLQNSFLLEHRPFVVVLLRTVSLMKMMRVTSPVTVCIVLSVQRGRHHAICARSSPAPMVTVKSLPPLLSYSVPIITTRNSVPRVWNFQALCRVWASVPCAHAGSVHQSFNGVSGVQFLMTEPDFPHQILV